MNSHLSGRRVLVVEDEIIVSWLLEDMLADLGIVVVGPAACVKQALAMIDGEAIDAAVLDINLDGQAPADRLASTCSTSTGSTPTCRSRRSRGR